MKEKKMYKKHQKAHKEHYKKIKGNWSDFERKYWKNHPDEKYCHICGETKDVQLHHIIPRHIDPNKIFDEDNLIPLCQPCHFRFGHLRNFEKYYDPDVRAFAKNALARIKKIRAEEDA